MTMEMATSPNIRRKIERDFVETLRGPLNDLVYELAHLGSIPRAAVDEATGDFTESLRGAIDDRSCRRLMRMQKMREADDGFKEFLNNSTFTYNADLYCWGCSTHPKHALRPLFQSNRAMEIVEAHCTNSERYCTEKHKRRGELTVTLRLAMDSAENVKNPHISALQAWRTNIFGRVVELGSCSKSAKAGATLHSHQGQDTASKIEMMTGKAPANVYTSTYAEYKKQFDDLEGRRESLGGAVEDGRVDQMQDDLVRPGRGPLTAALQRSRFVVISSKPFYDLPAPPPLSGVISSTLQHALQERPWSLQAKLEE